MSDSNLNIESENKEYLDSEMNFRNKQEKNDYETDKDIEYLNVNIPYTIKVNLNKKNIHNLSNSINTNNGPIFNFNKSIHKKKYNDILLLKENIIKLEVKKSNIKYTEKDNKKYIFSNEDEIINFVKNKLNEKNTKYLLEIQSKNYISNIFGNSDKINSTKKKTNNYTGFTLIKKVKGKNNYEIELTKYNLEQINKILKNEDFGINGDYMIFSPISDINSLKEEYKKAKWEYNKIKEENRIINFNSNKLKEENSLIKMKYGKFKLEYDYLIRDIKMVNYKRKEYLEEINKKDMIIKKYEKKINENQNELRNLEKKLSFYKNKTNTIFSIKNEIQIKLINNDEKKNCKIILRSKPKLLTVENSIYICYNKINNLGNKDNIKGYINVNCDKKKKENIFEAFEIENFSYNSKYKLREKEWIYDKKNHNRKKFKYKHR